MAEERSFHEPVMVKEVLELLLRGGVGLYIDGTLGGGGHARALLERCTGCRLLGIDRDPEAVERASRNLAAYGDRLRIVPGRFDRVLEEEELGPEGAAGALLDLGVSARQLDADERGFSFRPDVPLDMRMGAGAPGEDEEVETAAWILNEASEERLARIFREWGEEPRGRRLAREVVRRRRTKAFRTSDDLVAALDGALGRGTSSREKARIFQALRIAVNDELEALEGGLPLLRDALRPGGVLVVLSYHSLEDRRVKRAFREWSRSCVCPPRIPVCRCRGEPLGERLIRGPRRPSEEEVERNPKARSARLRAWRKGS